MNESLQLSEVITNCKNYKCYQSIIVQIVIFKKCSCLRKIALNDSICLEPLLLSYLLDLFSQFTLSLFNCLHVTKEFSDYHTPYLPSPVYFLCRTDLSYIIKFFSFLRSEIFLLLLQFYVNVKLY